MMKLVIIGSNSIHCKRYIAGVAQSKRFNISLISNHKMAEFPQLSQVTVNFAIHNLRAVNIIYDELTKIEPDIIHIHQANSYAWHSIRAIKRLKKRPKVILTAWGSDVLLLPRKNRLLAKMVQYNLANVDVITSDSLFMSARIAELLEGESKPIHTINFGIQYLPEMQQLAKKEKIILSNRLHRSLYRVDKIIKAFANLVSAKLIDKEYRLIIAGDGEENHNLRKLSQELGLNDRVEFMGLLDYDSLVNYYQKAQVFVSVPSSDGTASSLLESMAYGCIPVLSNLPANLEWVLDQINGFIVPSIDDLEEQILQAILLSSNIEDYQKLYQFNYDLIQKKATFINNIQNFIDLY